MTDKDAAYIAILKEELVPALGCTEPIALAYASAECRRILGREAEWAEAECSGNIIKNVKSVVIPNSGGLKGIEAAVAAGMIGGDASLGLEVLSAVREEDLVKVREFLARRAVKVSLLDTAASLHFIIRMGSGDDRALVEVKHQHTNIVREELNGEVLVSRGEEGGDMNGALTDRSVLNVADIIRFGESVDLEAISPVIEEQIRCNTAICEEGLRNRWGSGIGQYLKDTRSDDFLTAAKAIAAAGSDARMSGCEYPVVINSGSGNQGIPVSMPVVEYARRTGAGHERLVRALAISNLIAIHQKTKIGRLSAYCGAVNAACGAAAAITWLEGGTQEQIDETISNTLATISGMVCDGAKPSCAAKISLAVEAALMGHDLAMENDNFLPGDGIVKSDVEATISGIGDIASKGMVSTDKRILSVMVDG